MVIACDIFAGNILPCHGSHLCLFLKSYKVTVRAKTKNQLQKKTRDKTSVHIDCRVMGLKLCTLYHYLSNIKVKRPYLKRYLRYGPDKTKQWNLTKDNNWILEEVELWFCNLHSFGLILSKPRSLKSICRII